MNIFFIFQYLMGMKSAPLSKVASLNLTGSLSNVDYPMDLIKFSTMFQLVTIKQYFLVFGKRNVHAIFVQEELVLSQNAIVSWRERKFENCSKLSVLRMARNWDYINLTEAMVEDFRGTDIF